MLNRKANHTRNRNFYQNFRNKTLINHRLHLRIFKAIEQYSIQLNPLLTPHHQLSQLLVLQDAHSHLPLTKETVKLLK